MSAPRRRVTINDVADRAGVSVTTVSMALSGQRPVSEETKARVLQVIAELGYRPNAIARSLRTRRTHTVALLVPDITNPFYPMLARGVDDTLATNGFRLFIANSDASPIKEREFLKQAPASQVDGVIAAVFHLTGVDVDTLGAAGVPIVGLGDALAGPRIDTVVGDDETGAAATITYLLGRGHTRIGVIAGPAGVRVADARLRGARRAAKEAGHPIDPRFIERGDFTLADGEKAARSILERSEAPTALVCGNDLMAIGAMNAALAMGLSIPGDVAVVGYDDIDAATLVAPRLTTVHNPAYAMGTAAAELLCSRLERPSMRRRRIVVSHQLVARESA
jgi:LacI family transcriptional regulator